ncbi:splicing factor Cactin-like isoform X2 [Dysidea avara]|uniref:splicing factor Cactin-like isoform X2 n=1 Tax=Dysidea avara TaxID=196820 RepID=UPI003322365E
MPRKHKRSRSRSSDDDESSRSRSRSPRPKKKSKEEKERQKKEKEIMKALETPEEKRARRLAKKEAKERKRRQNLGWDSEQLEYTNTNNPFGDHHLLEKFVWHKKRDQEVSKMKLTETEVEERERLRQTEMKRELEKVKRRRIEREREKEARDNEMTMLQRLKEAEMFKEWEQQEDHFHLEQAKLRSQIRIETGRAKPIDVLAKYVNSSDNDIEIQEPYQLLRGLNRNDLEDLLEDIKVYIELENKQHLEYWKDMTIVCEDELQKLRRLDPSESDHSHVDRRGGINPTVSGDVAAIFKGKTYGQLLALQQQIQAKIDGDNAVDIGYWEALLQQLRAHMARARLRDRHQAMLRKKLFQLKVEEAATSSSSATGDPLFPIAATEGTGESEISASDKPGPSGTTTEGADDVDMILNEEEILKKAYDSYTEGCYSPKLLKLADIPVEEELTEEDADQNELVSARELVRKGGKLDQATNKKDEERKLQQTVNSDGSVEEEYTFNSELQLKSKEYIWQNKYKPRKPRFFNRVHTGFEWNKYNQTHYDIDNPPPKLVQGYKFNIFYPDLIDKKATPQFHLDPDPSPDFAVLRFHAGPPYEDIGFRIVNREWECSSKRGFRSQFSNNIFQLWFRFKRDRYRR